MRTNPLLDLFESLQHDFGKLTVDEFTNAMVSRRNAFEFFGVVSGTPLVQLYHRLSDCVNAVVNQLIMFSVRENMLEQLRYMLKEAIDALRVGAVIIPRKRLREEVVNKVTDGKVRQLCFELNTTPDQNVLSLAQLIGEALKWVLWHKAKANGTSLTEDGALAVLLNEAISRSYYSGKAATRFLAEFKTNFMKTGYDMVRHSESYIPDITVLNPQIDALEAILTETF